ncbi:hypothetical protein Golax_019780, partial [Gossypium laxum]|nr:hypothetical protein [Gossypium laxum]
MPMPLTCLGHKHISGVQLQMTKDRIIETYIHNLSAKAQRVIEQHLQEAGFLHVSRILRGTKLELALISVLLEMWRPETHAFHLPCGECTITLKDVALQLSLPVDRIVVTGWNNDKSHVGIPNELEDIRLLLDQRSKVEFEWMSYSDLKFQECIPTKFLANHNIWHAIVPLIVFAMVEMHEFDRKPNMTPDEVASVVHTSSSSSLTPTPNTIPMGAPLPDQYVSYFSRAFTNAMFFTQAPHYVPLYHASTPFLGIFFAPPLSPRAYYTPLSLTTPMYLSSPTIPAFYPQSGHSTLYTSLSIVSQTPLASLFFRGGSSLQPLINTTDDIQWEPRMQMHSSMEEQDEDEDNVGDEDQDQDGGKDTDGDEYEDDEPKPNHNEILLVVDCHRVVAHIRTKDGNDFLILKFSH